MPDAADKVNQLAGEMEQDYADGWRPSEGDMVVGKVTDVAKGNSEYGEYVIVTIHDETTDKDVALHCFHFVLAKKMRELKPRVGEIIAVKYVDQKPTKDGKRTVHNYNVRVQGRSVDVWGDEPVAAQATPEAEAAKEVEEETSDDDMPF